MLHLQKSIEGIAVETRITDRSALSNPIQALISLSPYLENSPVEKRILGLVEVRASQINGCALCLAMHTKSLLEEGERPDRLAVLSAWRDSGWFTEREQAALAWAEAVTTLEHQEVPDAVYEQASSQFSVAELADLTLATIIINGWNRLNVAFRNPPTAFTVTERETADAAQV